MSIKGVILSQRLRALILKVHLPRFLCLICLWLSWRSMSASTHHLYDPGFLPRSLLLGDDVLGQNYAAEQGADAGAGRCSNLHHGRPVHGGPLLLQTNRRPESPCAVLPSVRERLPTGACTQPKILYAAREHSLCGNFVFGGRINSEAENNLTLL